jgi:hypothetical protein
VRIATIGADLLSNVARFINMYVGDNDSRTFASQCVGDCLANASRASGNKSYPSLKFRHFYLPIFYLCRHYRQCSASGKELSENRGLTGRILEY